MTPSDPEALRRIVATARRLLMEQASWGASSASGAKVAADKLADHLWRNAGELLSALERAPSPQQARDAALEEAALAVTDGSIFHDEGGEKAAERIRALKSAPPSEPT